MNAVELLVLQQELIAAHVPGHMASFRHDLPVGRRGNEAPFGFFKITLVFKRQGLAQTVLQLDCEIRRHFPFRMEVLALHCPRIRQHTAAARGEGSGAESDKQSYSKGECQNLFGFHSILLTVGLIWSNYPTEIKTKRYKTLVLYGGEAGECQFAGI